MSKEMSKAPSYTEQAERSLYYCADTVTALKTLAVYVAVACDELHGIRKALNAGKDDGK